MTEGLGNQLMLPGGASAASFGEVMRKPASVVLGEGHIPPAPSPIVEANVVAVRKLEEVEAKVLLEHEAGRRRLPKVPVDATDTIRTRHHAIARMLASGAKYTEIQQAIGVSPASVKLLERAPAFQALLLEYMNVMDKAAIEVSTKLKILDSVSVDELTDRVLNARPETLKTTELLEITKLAADRTGLGPTTKNISLNGRLTAADIRMLKNGNTETVFEADSADWVEVSGTDGDASVCEEDGASDEDSKAGSGVGKGDRKAIVTTDDLSDLKLGLDAFPRPRR